MNIILTRENEKDTIIIHLPENIGAECKVEQENQRYNFTKEVEE